jgi:hypothetical protein
MSHDVGGENLVYLSHKAAPGSTKWMLCGWGSPSKRNAANVDDGFLAGLSMFLAAERKKE